MFKTITALSTLCVVTSVVSAGVSYDYSASYGWEDPNGGTILGSYGNLGYANIVDDPMGGGGNGVLELFEDPVSGTPQAYVGWITGLTDGDSIYASFMALGHNDLSSSSIRIWAHYTTNDDITAYEGSAGGNNTYSGADWTLLDHNWTFDSNDGERGGLVIEARIYTTSGDSGAAWVDDLFMGVNDSDGSGGVNIYTPGNIPAPGALALLGLAGLSRRRRS